MGYTFGCLERLRAFAQGERTIIMSMHEFELPRQPADSALILCGDGSHGVGDTDRVVSPALLAEAFGVDVRLESVGLVLRPGSIGS